MSQDLQQTEMVAGMYTNEDLTRNSVVRWARLFAVDLFGDEDVTLFHDIYNLADAGFDLEAGEMLEECRKGAFQFLRTVGVPGVDKIEELAERLPLVTTDPQFLALDRMFKILNLVTEHNFSVYTSYMHEARMVGNIGVDRVVVWVVSPDAPNKPRVFVIDFTVQKGSVTVLLPSMGSDRYDQPEGRPSWSSVYGSGLKKLLRRDGAVDTGKLRPGDPVIRKFGVR